MCICKLALAKTIVSNSILCKLDSSPDCAPFFPFLVCQRTLLLIILSMAQIAIELNSLWKRENINALKFMHYSRKYSAHSHFGPVRGWVGLSAGRLAKFIGAVWNRTHKNVKVYGRSEDETQRKCILQAEKHYAWDKKTQRRTFVSLGKNCFFSLRSKKQPFFPQETKVRLRVFLSLA